LAFFSIFSLSKQLDSLKGTLKEKETRINELELFKSGADKNMEDLRSRLEQERNQSYDALSAKKKAEENYAMYFIFVLHPFLV